MSMKDQLFNLIRCKKLPVGRRVCKTCRHHVSMHTYKDRGQNLGPGPCQAVDCGCLCYFNPKDGAGLMANQRGQ